MNYFESKLTKLVNLYFTELELKGIAYRLKQSKFNLQYVDILVDSGDKQYYSAIECKRLKGVHLYFSAYFHNVSQILNLTNFLELTGRSGYLAILNNRKISIIPWEIVLLELPNKKISAQLISQYCVDQKSKDWFSKALSRNRTYNLVHTKDTLSL